jgi:hypothetical protein
VIPSAAPALPPGAGLLSTTRPRTHAEGAGRQCPAVVRQIVSGRLHELLTQHSACSSDRALDGLPLVTSGRPDQRCHVPVHQIVGFGMSDSSHEAVVRNLQQPRRQLLAQRSQRRSDVRRRWLAQRPGSQPVRQRPYTVPVQLDRPRRPARQPVLEPVLHRRPDRVSRRRLNPTLSSACNARSLSRTSCLVLPETFRRSRFPSGPKPTKTVPTLRFFSPRGRWHLHHAAAPDPSVRHGSQGTHLALASALCRPDQEPQTPSDLVGATGFEPVTLACKA